MTEAEKNERIKAVEEEMAKLQKELEDIRNSKTTPKWDFSEWDDCPIVKKYEFYIPAGRSSIARFDKKLDTLTKLMKFKFCYDYKYEPDWSNKDEYKWFVYFDESVGIYKFNWAISLNEQSTVYFSSGEIAQKCVDWLHEGCPGYLGEENENEKNIL